MSGYSAKPRDQSDLKPAFSHYTRKTAVLNTRTLELFTSCTTAPFKCAISQMSDNDRGSEKCRTH